MIYILIIIFIGFMSVSAYIEAKKVIDSQNKD
jgi:hypothetical protein